MRAGARAFASNERPKRPKHPKHPYTSRDSAYFRMIDEVESRTLPQTRQPVGAFYRVRTIVLDYHAVRMNLPLPHRPNTRDSQPMTSGARTNDIINFTRHTCRSHSPRSRSQIMRWSIPNPIHPIPSILLYPWSMSIRRSRSTIPSVRIRSFISRSIIPCGIIP